MKANALFLFLALVCSSCGKVPESNPKTSVAPTPISTESSSTEEGTPKLPKNPETAVYSYSFPNLSKTTMPITGWVAPWHVDEVNHQTIEQYRRIKEAGLNCIYGLYERIGVSDPYVYTALDLASQAGIGYLVRDESLGVLAEEATEFKEHMDAFAEYSSFAGIFAADEPGKNRFSSFVAARKMMRQYYTKYAYYLNTFPMYATGTQFSGTSEEITYDDYVTSFLSTVQPQMFSYDFYGTNGDFPAVDEGYFKQIYASKNYADAYRVPFWPFLQACSYGRRTRIPRAEDIYWQVGANVVYGAKAIQWFCYQTPYEEQSWGGNFIDAEGNKTALFPYFQRANAFVASVDDILMRSSLVDMLSFGSSPAPLPEEQEFVQYSRELASVSTQDDALIGMFNHEGKTAIYVLNNNMTKDANLILRFVAPVDATVISFDDTNEETGIESLSLHIKAGESALVDLTNY